MSWKAELRAAEAAKRRRTREAVKRQRELEKQAKEQAALSALEQARLEVESYENRLEVLLSVHKDCGETWDWLGIAIAFPPVCPKRTQYHERKSRQQAAVLPDGTEHFADGLIQRGIGRDDSAFETDRQAYDKKMVEWAGIRSLARRILAGEAKAYTQALVELSPFAEISDVGSSIYFTVHTPKLVECSLKVNALQAIPTETKTLTAGGKLSIKAMPKVRFSEIYQDYVCGCVLRVARETFALLPVDTLLLTVTADSPDSSTGHTVEVPVLSVALPREQVVPLDFERLDPSDCIEAFQHSGDLKVSRKAEALQAITPLTPADIAVTAIAGMSVPDLLSEVQKLRDEIKLNTNESEADSQGIQ